MKKTSIFFAATIMVVAASCQKGLEDNNAPAVKGESSEVVLTAKLPDTKTSLEDGYKVSWTQNDQIAVFNAKTGTTDYSANLHFYIDENAEGKFTAGEGTIVPFEDGVNYTAGLPVVRTSPDHGTAYEMAGRDLADPRSMKAAIYAAMDIFNNREAYDELIAGRMTIKLPDTEIKPRGGRVIE